MKKFLVGGEIVGDSAQQWAVEDVTPNQVRAAIKNLEDGEDITFEISSPGGSVTAGIAIANLIKQASADGHPTKAHVIGIAASMASVIACACDEIDIDESAFMMIHNPWTVAQGDADDLRKSADLLDQMKGAILSFYRSKFDKTDDELCELMDAETWFTGAEIADFNFKANMIPNEEPLKLAACAREIPGFNKIPDAARSLLALGQHKEPKMEEQKAEVTEKVQAVVEPVAEPKAEEVKPAEPVAVVEEPKDVIVDEPKMVSLEECEKRVSGMQSAMAKQINALRDEYEAKITDFTNQLKVKDEELAVVNAKVTSLVADLEKSAKELSEKASALEEKNTALETLNSKVNHYAEIKKQRGLNDLIADKNSSVKERMAAARLEADKNKNSKR